MTKVEAKKLRQAEEERLISALAKERITLLQRFLQQGWKPDEALSGTNPLNFAGGVKTAKYLVKIGAKIDAGFDWLPPLVSFAQSGETKMVDCLLRLGANPDAAFKGKAKEDIPSGTTGLMVAAGNGAVDVVRRLLNAKADSCLRDEHGQNALSHALSVNQVSTAKELLRRGSDLTKDALCGPVKHGNTALIRMLILKGANVNAVFKRHGGDKSWPENGVTLLGYAIDHTKPHGGDYPKEIVKMLLAAGAEPNRSSMGLFLRRDSDPPTPGFGPVTPLRIAGRRGLKDVIQLLFKAGAKGTLRDAMLDCTPEKAAYHGNISVLKLIIEAGVEIDAPGEGGLRPIEYARKEGQTEAVKLLKKAGAKD